VLALGCGHRISALARHEFRDGFTDHDRKDQPEMPSQIRHHDDQMATPEENTTPTRRKPGPRPGTEAAKRGGTAARDKYGKEFYSRIGSLGGSRVRERHGSAFYTEIGRRGGESTKQHLGSDHYARIGRIGGMRAHRKNGAGDTSTENGQ